MATWIVHLRLAEKLYKELDGLKLDKTGFYLGNVAIDSGKVNDDFTCSPPKSVTHWLKDETQEYECRYKDFFQAFLSGQTDTFSFSFYLGCVVHLIADNMWYQNVVKETKDKYRKERSENDKFMLLPKKDWYDVDYLFVRENSNFEPLKVLAEMEPFKNTYLPWFDEDAVQLKVNELLEFYKTIPDDIDRDYMYFNRDTMEQFIDKTVAIVKQELLQLFNMDMNA